MLGRFGRCAWATLTSVRAMLPTRMRRMYFMATKNNYAGLAYHARKITNFLRFSSRESKGSGLVETGNRKFVPA